MQKPRLNGEMLRNHRVLVTGAQYVFTGTMDRANMNSRTKAEGGRDVREYIRPCDPIDDDVRSCMLSLLYKDKEI